MVIVHKRAAKMFQQSSKVLSEVRRRRFKANVRRKFAIIASNCWGAEVYRELEEPYLTPFVGLFLYPESFIALCYDIDRFLREDPLFDVPPVRERIGAEHYPVGTFPATDIQLHFLHYASREEAALKWRRRADRAKATAIPKVFMFCDRDGATEEHFARFEALPASDKACFTATDHPKYESVRPVNACRGRNEVVDGKALYPHTRREFDLASWLNGDGLRRRWLPL